MKKASDILNPDRLHGRKSEKITEKTLLAGKAELDSLGIEGIMHERPKIRAECPDYRPCPYVGCRYNNYLEIMENGGIRFNFNGIEPFERNTGCTLDLAEKRSYNSGEIADAVGMTRTTVNQEVRIALEKIKELEQNLTELCDENI